MKNVFIMVADAATARIFEANKDKGSFLQVANYEHTHETTQEHGKNRAGKVFESDSPLHHAYEPKTDWHEHQKELFTKELAEIFKTAHQAQKFPEAYLVLPPVMMGYIRKFLIPHVDKLPSVDKPNVTEIAKDLTHQTLEDIKKYIESFT